MTRLGLRKMTRQMKPARFILDLGWFLKFYFAYFLSLAFDKVNEGIKYLLGIVVYLIHPLWVPLDKVVVQVRVGMLHCLNNAVFGPTGRAETLSNFLDSLVVVGVDHNFRAQDLAKPAVFF